MGGSVDTLPIMVAIGLVVIEVGFVWRGIGISVGAGGRHHDGGGDRKERGGALEGIDGFHESGGITVSCMISFLNKKAESLYQGLRFN